MAQIDVKALLNRQDKADFIGEKMIALVQYRIEQEELSSRIYRAMSAYLDISGFTGAAKLWMDYSEEEQEHANEFFDYLLKLNVCPNVPALLVQPKSFSGLRDVVQKSLEHELVVTNQINTLASEAMKAGDFMTMQLAQKFLNEQIEELNKVRTWADRIEIVGEDKCGLLIIDQEMGKAAK